MSTAKRWDDTTWDTSQVYDQIMNNEPDYRTAHRCLTVSRLRENFDHSYPDIDWDEIDWDLIFDTIQEE